MAPFPGFSYRAEAQPGAQPGKLVLESPKFGNKQWQGAVEPDGSVLYIGVGMLKAPYRVKVDAQGRTAMGLRPFRVMGPATIFGESGKEVRLILLLRGRGRRQRA